MRELVTLINKFRITSEISGVNRIIEGHIHDSFRITTVEGSEFVLQRINAFVFKDVDTLMNNLGKVLSHLENRRKKTPSHFPASLCLVNTWNGKSFLSTPDGNFWRLFQYIPNSHVYNTVSEPLLAYEGGKAFGAFLLELSDLDPKQLKVILPRFHDFNFRYQAYEDSVQSNKADRLKDIAEEINFVAGNKTTMLEFNDVITEGTVPVRVTHNDTKFNNILFDNKNQPLCVIDLDTVMPGSMLHDYGDAIRTVANTAKEDETDLTKVTFNFPIFRAFTKGYLKSAAGVLTPTEVANLPNSAIYLTFLIGLRFLTDHLNGDEYYHISRPSHNLDRARVQFAMVRAMQTQLKKMNQTIKEIMP